MKSLNDNLPSLIGSEPNYRAPETPKAGVKTTPEMAVAVKNLFKTLCAAFPAWRAAFPTAEMYKTARRLWLEELLDAQITPEQVQIGLSVAKRLESPFFPSVGQFIAWCRNGNPYAELSLPTPDELMCLYNKFRNSMCEDLARYPWKSAVEFHLVSQLKRAIYDGNLDTETALKRAKDIIDRTAKRLQAGEQFAPPSAPKLDKPKSAPISTERQLAHIANLKAILGRSTRQVVLQ